MSYFIDCQAEGCRRRVAPPRCFCSQHWKEVPDALRKRIWTAQVGGEDSPEYLAALLAAVEAVAAAEGRREPSAFPDFQTEVMR